ncbi:MAG: glycosyltransferase family 2 protein [Chloroflexi bacterium]|nr:glycosyltransferase family 2 protein [Chloroflexota bacterium]
MDTEDGASMVGHGPVTLSFVIPVYNEEGNIEPLCRRIQRTCAENEIASFEVILVENGSWDESEAVIRKLHKEDPRFKMLQLSRNFTYQGGVSAGLAYATGEWVAVLDGDQQDPPELVARMLEKAREGFEVVYGVRVKRQEGLAKRLAYAAFYRLWKATAQIQVPLDAGDFCVMHRKVVKCIASMPERHRFVRGLRAWTGFRQTGVEYERQARAGGRSKFDPLALTGLALDGLLSFSVIPLRLMTLCGLGVASVSFLVGAAQVGVRVAGWFGLSVPFPPPPGFTQINLIITFLLGFNILCIGVLGEYVGRIYQEVKERPIFVVRAKLFGEGNGEEG